MSESMFGMTVQSGITGLGNLGRNSHNNNENIWIVLKVICVQVMYDKK